MAQDFDIFSLSARCRPMLRLLDGDDLEFVNRAGDAKLLSKVRRQRRAIFRDYLRNLREDREYLTECVRALVVCADTDQAELVSSLFQSDWSFRFLMLKANMGLALHALGASRVAVSGLMDCFEKLRSQAESLAMLTPAANLA